jgi:branched-chain amino acid transport system ATP-binding protein
MMSGLIVHDLHAHYGKSHILHGVDFAVPPGEIVGLVGRNGSGRSTALKSIMGIVPPSQGSITVDGTQLAGLRPFRAARAGVAYVPEERLIFCTLTVEENLQLGVGASRPGAPTWEIEQMYAYFPRLKERRTTRAGSLSGGEQQMLTMCRSLLGNPKTILIDEPTEGLAPKIVDGVMAMITDIASRGVGVLLVEQKLTIVPHISQRMLVMGHGQIVFDGSSEALKSDSGIRRTWLEVA